MRVENLIFFLLIILIAYKSPLIFDSAKRTRPNAPRPNSLLNLKLDNLVNWAGSCDATDVERRSVDFVYCLWFWLFKFCCCVVCCCGVFLNNQSINDLYHEDFSFLNSLPNKINNKIKKRKRKKQTKKRNKIYQ